MYWGEQRRRMAPPPLMSRPGIPVPPLLVSVTTTGVFFFCPVTSYTLLNNVLLESRNPVSSIMNPFHKRVIVGKHSCS